MMLNTKNNYWTQSLATMQNNNIHSSETQWLSIYFNTFKNSHWFHKKSFQKWDILFEEWESDENLYIIESWRLSVEKYTTDERKETKQLAILWTWSFFGEWSLSTSQIPKEVTIKSLENCEVFYIQANQDLKKFVCENPEIGYELMSHIILETNTRLLEVNSLFTSNYEIEKAINNIKQVNIRNIFWLLDKIKHITKVDYILYFEKHQILENFLTLKYDTREVNKMQDTIFEKSWVFLNLDEIFSECDLNPNDKILTHKLNIWLETFWYLLIGRSQNWYSTSDKKVFSSITNSLSGLLKKRMVDDEYRNQTYIEETKKQT